MNEMGTIYTANVKWINSASLPLTEVQGEHEPGRSNEDVVGFVLFHQPGSYIPKDIDKFFPNIVAIEWYHSQLLTITSGDLKQFPNLLYLVLDNNKLETLESDLFMFNPKIKYLHLAYNNVHYVGHDLFTNLTQLQVVHFSQNPCIDFFAKTSDQVKELNVILPIECPMSNKCPKACVDRMDQMAAQIANYGDRILELERSIN